MQSRLIKIMVKYLQKYNNSEESTYNNQYTHIRRNSHNRTAKPIFRLIYSSTEEDKVSKGMANEGKYEKNHIITDKNDINKLLDWKILEFNQSSQLVSKGNIIVIIMKQHPSIQVENHRDTVSKINETENTKGLLKNIEDSNNHDKLVFADGDHIDYTVLDNVMHGLILDEGQKMALRGNWRQACDKSAAKSCIKACKRTLKETCRELKCKKRLRKVLTKQCKSKCNHYFDVKKKHDSSGSSEDKTDCDTDDDDTTTKKPKDKTTTEKKEDETTTEPPGIEAII